MVAEQHGLGRLDVGRARQDGPPVAVGQADERALEPDDRGIEAVDRPARPEPQVRGDLVVARPAGVEPARDRPDALGQRRLEVEVDVLEGGVPREAVGGDVLGERQQPGDELVDLLAGQQPRPAEPAHVRDRARDVVGRQLAVDRRSSW